MVKYTGKKQVSYGLFFYEKFPIKKLTEFQGDHIVYQILHTALNCVNHVLYGGVF